MMPKPLLKPKPLQPGDTIAVVSTSAPTTDPSDAFEQGIALLEAEGFKVKLMPHAKAKDAYLAGSDDNRLADLHAAFSDPAVQGILCARGGYGAMRLLAQIDYELIRQNPKIFIGFSDITALHLAFYKRCGLVGFYGPMLTSNLINGEPQSQKELFDMVCGKVCGKNQMHHTVKNLDTYHCFNAGEATGKLIGGNLSLITALCGTPYLPSTEGAILFLEDWKEQYYELDRKFQQLKLAGLLDNIAGLVLCDFSEIEPEPEFDPTFDKIALLKKLTADIFANLSVPVGYGFSVGHGEQTMTLPIGTQAQFNAGTGKLVLLESPVN